MRMISSVIKKNLGKFYNDCRYENEGVFTSLQLQQVRKATLAAVLCNSGDHIDRIQVKW